MSESIVKLPVVALRGMNVLPGMLIHFDISRKMTVAAIEEAMIAEQKVFITAQIEEETEKPERADLYNVGTVCLVKQMVKLPDETLRVMVEGIERATILELDTKKPYLEAVIRIEEIDTRFNMIEEEAMIRQLKELLHLHVTASGKNAAPTLKRIAEVKNIARLTDEIAASIPISLEERQVVLEELDVRRRFEYLSILMTKEIEIMRIKREFQVKVKGQVDKNQKEYLLREQMKVIQEELGEEGGVSQADKFMEKVEKLKAPKEVKEKLREEIKRMKTVSSNSAESAVIRGYVETLLALPWDKTSKDNNDIANAERVLEEDHYGLKKVKERVLEFLAVRCLTKECDTPIVCLVGPPGTGKTSIARSVAKALNKKYVRICLGGVRDEAEIRGHRKTYIGAMPGRLAVGLKTAGVKNPLMLLDEIDKVSSDHKGDVSSALLEVLDSEQNSHFLDHYVEVPMDLSKVLFIATANSIQTIPRPLLDRMEVIEVSSYTENEKFHIAKEHLIPKTRRKNGLKETQLTISDKALETIIRGYTKEAGVRTLERKLGEICRKAARELLESEQNMAEQRMTASKGKTIGKKTSSKKNEETTVEPVAVKTAKSVKVTSKNLEKYLGRVKYTCNEANKEAQVGIVRGLAWTSVGGDTLEIEVNVMRGKGELKLTGKLGEVMKESAMTGLSYVRSVGEKYEIEEDFFEKHDIHIHIPEGAVPKDGPSAGITMATAMLSAITDKKVRADVAMTGEITLRGRVLAIGGLKEKLLAAKAAKIALVLVPKENKKDIEEIEEEILEGISVQYVENMEQVLKYALDK